MNALLSFDGQSRPYARAGEDGAGQFGRGIARERRMMNHEQKAGRLETWRAVVVAPGFGRLRATMTLDAIEFFDPRVGWVWRASHRTTCWCGGTPHDAVATSAPAAVLVALASFGRVHDKVVEEVRGPGERTTADRVASAEREVQRRCVLICESVALAQPDAQDRRDLASDAAEAIRGMVFSDAGTDELEEQLAAALSEIRVARRQLEIEHASHVATAAARDAAEAECDRLRALLARPFRVTPPTPAEVEAQHALGRGWRVEDLRGSVQHLRGTALNERFLSGRVPLRWSAEDAERRPCAWPPSEVLARPLLSPTDEGDPR